METVTEGVGCPPRGRALSAALDRYKCAGLPVHRSDEGLAPAIRVRSPRRHPRHRLAGLSCHRLQTSGIPAGVATSAAAASKTRLRVRTAQPDGATWPMEMA